MFGEAFIAAYNTPHYNDFWHTINLSFIFQRCSTFHSANNVQLQMATNTASIQVHPEIQ